MADATLLSIDAALFAALKALEAGPPTDAQPFALVARYAGEWSREGVQTVCAQYPACLLRLDGEANNRDIEVMGLGAEDIGHPAWSVAVVLEEPRSFDDAIQGAAGVPGLLALLGAVTGACNRLFVDGLWRNRTVRYVRAAAVPQLTVRGAVYAYAATFEARRLVEQAPEPADDSVPLAGIDAAVNLEGTADPVTNPFERLAADTTVP